MAKLLLAAPEHVGIIDIIIEGLKKYTDYSIDFLDLNPAPFSYKGKTQRVYNFFLKAFRQENIKTKYYNNYFLKKIDTLEPEYDIIIIIRPDIVSDSILKQLRSKTDLFIAYYWDTISLFPRKLKIREFFNKIYSFDAQDCKKYGFSFLSNFYYYEEENPVIKYQVYNIFYFDSRSIFIEKIADLLEELGITYLIKAMYFKPFNSRHIQYLPEVLNYRSMLKELAACNVILEVQKKNQTGLTFRPFEALGLNKKLITTNPEIKNYDFYNEKNILILNPDHEPVIPMSFINSPYEPVDPAKKEKYHLKQFIKTIVSE